MADAFRGLTIRLGADARPLNSAINSISKSAGQAQRQMNMLSKALKFNPGDTRAMAKMVDLAGDKALHAARQVQTLRSALNQAGNESQQLFRKSSFKNSSIRDLARDTTNAYAATQKLRAEHQHVNAELQHIYDAAKRVYGRENKINWNDASEQVNKLRKQFTAWKTNIDKTGEAGDKAREQIHRLVKMAGEGTKVGSLFGIEQSKAGGDKLVEVFKKLQAESKNLNHDLEAMNKVEGFRAMENALIAARAEMREAANEAARLKSQLYSFGGSESVAKAVTDAHRLDSALEKAVHTADEMKAAFKAMPGSIDAARDKMKSLADAEEIIKEKIKSTREAMKAIERTPGFDKMRASTTNAALAVEKLQGKFAELKTKEVGAASSAQRLEQMLSEINMLTLNKPTANVDELRMALKEVGVTGKSALAHPVETFNKLASAAEKAKERTLEVKSAINGVESEMKQVGAMKTWQEQGNELTKYKAKMESINFQKSIVSKLGGIGQSFRQFGYGLYASVTPAILMTGRYAIQAADEIDSSYRDMRKTVNGTEEQFEHLKDAAIEFSRTHVTSASQILDIEAIGGQLGISAKDLEAFANTVSNLDIATNMDTEDIALDLAKLSNIMHFGQEEFDNFADALVRLGNNEPALESDIMKISTRFAGMASNVDMGTADMLAFATAATATGQKAEAAGSSMQRTISRIGGAVSSGGEKLEQYAKISGMTADQFAKTWKDSENHGPAKAMQAFVEGLHRIKAEGGDVDSTLVGLGITGVRDKQLLAGLSNTTDILAESLQMANDAWNGMSTTMKDGSIEQAGDAAREAGRKSEGFSGELAKMKNNAAALAVELGEGAAPFIKDLGAMLKDLTTWFKDLDPGMKQFIVGAAGVTAALGPLSVGAGTFMSAISGIQGGLKSGQKVLTGWAAKLDPIGPQLTKTSKSASLLSRGLLGIGSVLGSGPAVAGIIAGGAALAFLGSKAVEEQQRIDTLKGSHERLSAATETLRSSSSRLNQAFDGDISSLEAFNAKAGQYREGVDKMAQKSIELADSIDSKVNGAFSDANLVQFYSDKIRELAGHCGGSSTKLNELKQAIERYNEMTGDSVGITDSFSGAINRSTEELEANTRAFQANMISKAYQSALEEAQAALAETNIEIVKNGKAIESAEKELGKYGITVDDAVEAMNNLGQGSLHPEYVEALNQKFGGTGWQDLARTILECNGNLVELSKTQEEQGQLVDASLESYMAAVEHQSAMTQQAEKAAEAEKKASTYIDALGKNGEKAFSKIKEKAGFAEQSSDQFAEALHDANISADLMGNVGTKAFSGFITQAQKVSDDVPTQLSLVQSAMMAVNDYGFDPKEITITDNGSIMTFEGHVVNLNNMTMDDKQFEVSDDGTLQFCEEQTVMLEGSLKRLDAMRVTPTVSLNDKISGQIDVAKGALQRLQGQSVSVKSTTATVGMDTSKFDKGSASVEKAMGNLGKLEATPKVDADVSSAISKFTRISTYNFSPKFVDVYIRQHGSMPSGAQAAGGINMTPMYAVPAFATGAALNGIVKRATLTNQGLVGEAGTEALMRIGRQTAVVPLSNRRYVRPFARAVAAEIGGTGQTQNNVTNISINGINVDSNGKMGTLVRELADYAVQSRRAG